MGFDPVTGIGTGCWPGMKNLAAYLFDRFGGGNLGCFNPRSMAGGGPSLHAEGRAQDFAHNAFDDDQRAAGDALFTWAVEHYEEIGLQEMLWRGAIWYWPRRNTEDGWGDFPLPGVYGPVQQADHMSHVHLGVDKDAGMNWTTDWLKPEPTPGDDDMKPMLMQPIPPGTNDPDQGKTWMYNPYAHTKTWIRSNDALNRAIALFGPPDPDPANAAIIADARTVDDPGAVIVASLPASYTLTPNP